MPCINTSRIPDKCTAFVSVKTKQLIVCDSGIYAIMVIRYNLSNKNIIMSSFKSSGDIQKKEGGLDSKTAEIIHIHCSNCCSFVAHANCVFCDVESIFKCNLCGLGRIQTSSFYLPNLACHRKICQRELKHVTKSNIYGKD